MYPEFLGKLVDGLDPSYRFQARPWLFADYKNLALTLALQGTAALATAQPKTAILLSWKKQLSADYADFCRLNNK